MHRYVIYIIALLTFSCRERITNIDNPFSKDYDVIVSQVDFQYFDTVQSGCGWWNAVQRKKGMDIYYQFYGDKPTLEAKGLIIYLDTFAIDSNNGAGIDSIMKLPIDTAFVNRQLSTFGAKVDKIEASTSEYFKNHPVIKVAYKNERFEEQVYFDIKSTNGPLVRYLGFFMGSPHNANTN